jgi:hypothetical protein
MPYLALDIDGTELIYDWKDQPDENGYRNFIRLPSGSIKKLIGRDLRKSEMPVEFKNAKDE